MKQGTVQGGVDRAQQSIVLIVDDDPIALNMMQVLLSQEGYTLALARDGADALAQAAALLPDLILLDVMMPRMDGFQVCQHLRADPLLGEVPVILITALDDRESRLRGVKAGADDFISKPFDPTELKARVRTITRLNRYRLLLERAKFEQLVHVSPDGLLVVDADGVIHLANPAMIQMLGIKERKDIVGQEMLTFVAPEQHDAHATWLHDTIAGTGQVEQIETELVRLNGERFSVEVSTARFVLNARPAVQITVRDITERKRMQEKLENSEETLRSLVNAITESALLIDITGTILAVNQTTAQRLGQDVEQLLGQCCYDFLPPGVAQSRRARVERVIRTGQPIQFEDVRSDKHIHNSIYPIFDTNGRVTRLAIFGLDLTKRKQAERELRRRTAQLEALRQVQVLNELDQALAATLDPKKVAQVALRQTATALQAPTGVMFILPSQANDRFEQAFVLEKGWIEVKATADNVQQWQSLRQRLQNHKIITPFSHDELNTISGQPDLAKEWGTNGLALPIWSERGLSAILALGGRPHESPFTKEDQALAQAAANRIGQALQSAYLYQASQQRSAHLVTLNAIGRAAVSSLELDTVLRQILQLTCQALDAVTGSVLMSEPDTGDLVFVVAIEDIEPDLRGYRLSLGQGIAGWVAQHGQTVCVDNVQQDPRWYNDVDTVTGVQTHSVMCAPLRHHDKVTGVIEIINKREGQFTQDDLSLLEAVSSIAAAALENGRLYTAMRAHATELALLNEIGLALTSTLDHSTVVHAALSQTQRLFVAEHVLLLQPDPKTGELCSVRTIIGGVPTEIPVHMPQGERIGEWVMERQQLLLIGDVQADPRFQDQTDRHVDARMRSLMAVPLLVRGRTIGVIEVASSEPGIYTQDELRILRALASTLAVALENASLYDELRSLLREWEDAQAQLIHAEKMTAIGRLAASIAHEINNPLQAVLSYLSLAQEEVTADQRPEQIKRYLGTVEEEIERISTIVRRMRDFYRPAREGLRPTDLHTVLQSVLELTNKQLQHSDVAVEKQWADHLPHIQANPDHIKQVMLNLVLNAIDAMPTGGILHISTALDQIQSDSDHPPQPAVRVEFSDTGAGMPPEIMSHLFEPFFTTKERGSGLGLSISYGIIESHKGQITVESYIGLGTTFTIMLPVG